ncbi:hypothetical protein ACFS07_01435 [Undibacterium arcticum]
MRPRFAPAGLLKAAGNNPSSAAVLRALENMGRKDLGGVVVNYSKNKKSASKRVPTSRSSVAVVR